MRGPFHTFRGQSQILDENENGRLKKGSHFILCSEATRVWNRDNPLHSHHRGSAFVSFFGPVKVPKKIIERCVYKIPNSVDFTKGIW